MSADIIEQNYQRVIDAWPAIQGMDPVADYKKILALAFQAGAHWYANENKPALVKMGQALKAMEQAK